MENKELIIALMWIMLLAACHSTRKTQLVLPQIMIDSTTNSADSGKIENEKIIVDKAKSSPFLEELLQKYPDYFEDILLKRKLRNVQVIYTQINRDENNFPTFTDYYFNVDSSKYFYPASTVKLPTALLALQKLNELQHAGLEKNTTMITEASCSGQIPTYNDPQTADGKPNIESYIKRIFLVSDNDAFNRLYEFLGQEYLNDQLHQKGYTDAQIIHRLEITLSEDENRHTNPINFLDSNGNIILSAPLLFNQKKYAERHDTLGKAYYKGGELINGPMNFSKKNRIALEDLHEILRSVIFPEAVPAGQKFNLTDSDYAFVRKYMSAFPGESVFPPYDSTIYYDAYGKLLFYGSQEGNLPKNIRIFNKEGDAYGELLDIAYVVDFDKNIEFFLSAAINCNTNEILNDDTYDYDSIGFPFMKHLGEVIYDYELKRDRRYAPDLSAFKIAYDK
ncbi:MAG: serine hydrolase [Ginsengibacter sp.]